MVPRGGRGPQVGGGQGGRIRISILYSGSGLNWVWINPEAWKWYHEVGQQVGGRVGGCVGRGGERGDTEALPAMLRVVRDSWWVAECVNGLGLGLGPWLGV